MYGDTTVLRSRARELREQGREIALEADSLVARAESVPWTGLAADAMRAAMRRHAAALWRCSTHHEEAADALERHAREVEHLVALIAAVERRVTGLLDDAAGAVGTVVSGVLPDGVGEWLDGFRPPPSGSMEWLDVQVPGW
jgi:hypothetical protein